MAALSMPFATHSYGMNSKAGGGGAGVEEGTSSSSSSSFSFHMPSGYVVPAGSDAIYASRPIVDLLETEKSKIQARIAALDKPVVTDSQSLAAVKLMVTKKESKALQEEINEISELSHFFSVSELALTTLYSLKDLII